MHRARTFIGIAGILVAQNAYVVLAYWARIETFIAQPGRFRGYEALLGSDFVVFIAPLALAFVAALVLLSRRTALGRVTALFVALLSALVAECVALFAAFDRWGT